MPQDQKLVLNVKSIKFSERTHNQRLKQFAGSDNQDSFEKGRIKSKYNNYSNNNNVQYQKLGTINKKGKKRSSYIINHMRRENGIGNALKQNKRPSTKEAIDRNNNISQLSEGIESASCQFNTAYPIKTPIKNPSAKSSKDVSYIKGSNSKQQSSTIGFSSSTHNTTMYNKTFGDSAFRSSKYTNSANGGEQSSITRSSFYHDRDLSETLMMRSQSYYKIKCPH